MQSRSSVLRALACAVASWCCVVGGCSTSGGTSDTAPVTPRLPVSAGNRVEVPQGTGERWLRKAGVTRAELFADTATSRAIRFHDLRATGITWMAIRGDDPLKIMQRAGHTDFATTQRYEREAEAIRDGFGEVFPPLPASVLGVASATDLDADQNDEGTES